MAQTAKKPGTPCGDVVCFDRTAAGLTLVCADGLGSGIKANLAANMTCARLLALLRGGASLRQAFGSVVRTMQQVRGTDLPYAVFSVARILPDGQATVLAYEIPPPLLLTRHQATIMAGRTLTLEGGLITEANCHLEPGEGLLLISDGLTQAGLGLSLKSGWQAEGVAQFLNQQLSARRPLRELAQAAHDRARELWENVGGDDCTAALALCRWGKVLNLITGPPSDQHRDREIAQRFLQLEGWKVACGATTADLVARALGRELTVEQDSRSALTPPRYYLEGVDLVTEGAITLNQVYNVLDEDPGQLPEVSGVTELLELLHAADRVNFLVGVAHNPAHGDIRFRQQGLLSRTRVIPLIADKLRQDGKLVTVEYY